LSQRTYFEVVVRRARKVQTCLSFLCRREDAKTENSNNGTRLDHDNKYIENVNLDSSLEKQLQRTLEKLASAPTRCIRTALKPTRRLVSLTTK
jgi:hypothetical protein